MSHLGRIGAVWKGGQRTRADEFVLRDGGRIRGLVVGRSNTELVLEVGAGRVTFCLSEIHRVVGSGIESHARF
jgi:hypothetical protein